VEVSSAAPEKRLATLAAARVRARHQATVLEKPESAKWWRARARALVHATLSMYAGRTIRARTLRRELRRDYVRHARRHAPHSTYRIWREVVAVAFGVGLLGIQDQSSMIQIPLPFMR
jgi:hypothetical protein